MLRLREVKNVYGNRIGNSDERESIDEVIFEGPAGEFADCRITLHMKPRADDTLMLADAHRILADAVAQLHREISESPSAAS